MNPTKTLSAGLLIAMLGAGCSSDYSQTQRGAATGAATGAVLGGVIGHQSGEATAGAAIGAAAGGIAGAAIGREQDRRAQQTTADRQVYAVQSPPPAPTSAPYETVPPRPSAEAVWIPGYYEYTGTGNQYTWVAGRWEVPPPGYRTWAPPTWQRSGDGWVYVRGHWQ